MNKTRTVLITGATGYIGSHLVRALQKEGNQVHIIVRQASQLDLLIDIKDKIYIHRYNEDVQQLYKIFDQIKPEIIIHLATLFLAQHTSHDIIPLIQSNIILGTQLLEVGSKSNVKYFINVGTSWQNYLGQDYNPVNLYSATKEAFEDIAKYYVESTSFRMITLKLIDTYGPFDPRGKVVNLFKKIAESQEVLEMSEGEQQLGLVYIDDVIKSFMLAIQEIENMKKHERRTYVVAPNNFCSLKKVAEIFEETSKKKLNIVWGKRPYRKREMMKIELVHANILEQQQTISLEEGIRKMLEIELKTSTNL